MLLLLYYLCSWRRRCYYSQFLDKNCSWRSGVTIWWAQSLVRGRGIETVLRNILEITQANRGGRSLSEFIAYVITQEVGPLQMTLLAPNKGCLQTQTLLLGPEFSSCLSLHRVVLRIPVQDQKVKALSPSCCRWNRTQVEWNINLGVQKDFQVRVQGGRFTGALEKLSQPTEMQPDNLAGIPRGASGPIARPQDQEKWGNPWSV